MKSIGEKDGLDLTQDVNPPKTLYVEVSIRVPELILDWVNSSSFFRSDV